MVRCLTNLWHDESGVVLSAELILIVTVAVLGLIVGLATLQNALVTEMQGTAAAFSSLNQSFAFTGFRGCVKPWGRTSWTAGSFFIDTFGTCVGTAGAMGVSEIGVGYGMYGGGGASGGMSGPVLATPGPVMSGSTPACPTCVPDAAQTMEPCLNCPGDGGGLPTPRTEIPQGPAPQISPQQ